MRISLPCCFCSSLRRCVTDAAARKPYACDYSRASDLLAIAIREWTAAAAAAGALFATHAQLLSERELTTWALLSP